MVVSVFGRAFSTQVLQPGEQPLIPQTDPNEAAPPPTPPPPLTPSLPEGGT
jgi:hypothetical protein